MESIGIDVDERHFPLRDRFDIFARGLNNAITRARHSGFSPEDEHILRQYLGSVVSYQGDLNSRELDPERVLSSKIAMLEAEGKVRDLIGRGDEMVDNAHNVAADLFNAKTRLFGR